MEYNAATILIIIFLCVVGLFILFTLYAECCDTRGGNNNGRNPINDLRTNGYQMFTMQYGRAPYEYELRLAYQQSNPEQKSALAPFVWQYGINPSTM
jgi:hypothetical protein